MTAVTTSKIHPALNVPFLSSSQNIACTAFCCWNILRLYSLLSFSSFSLCLVPLSKEKVTCWKAECLWTCAGKKSIAAGVQTCQNLILPYKPGWGSSFVFHLFCYCNGLMQMAVCNAKRIQRTPSISCCCLVFAKKHYCLQPLASDSAAA